MLKKTKKNASEFYWKAQEIIRDEELHKYNPEIYEAPEKSAEMLAAEFISNGFSEGNQEHAKELVQFMFFLVRCYEHRYIRNDSPFMLTYSYIASANFVWTELRQLFLHPSTPHRHLYYSEDARTGYVRVEVQE